MSFAKLIHDTYKVNLKMQRIVYHAMHTLMGSPYITKLHLKNVIEGKHRFSIVGAYEIWCHLYELLEMTYFTLVDLIK